MGINKKEFLNKVDIGLKATKDYKKFYYRFKHEEQEYSKILDYSNFTWDKKTRVAKAKSDALAFKENRINPVSEINENIKLHEFINQHFSHLPDTNWTRTKINHYNNYIASMLGKKEVVKVKQMHIKECIRQQEKLELKPRTIKTTLEILNPVFKEAIANRLINFNPCTGITIKIPKTKKIVTNASEQLSLIYSTILSIFKNDPFYLGFYLFAMQGRRKSEVLNLRWENIDFNTHKYIIEDTKNGEHQMYMLPIHTEELLKNFANSSGYVFESSIKRGCPINNIEKQTKKIKKVIPHFTLHYMRNVVVSAMADYGVSATLMSSAIGHNNTSTLSKYLTLNYEQGSHSVNTIIEHLSTNISSL